MLLHATKILGLWLTLGCTRQQPVLQTSRMQIYAKTLRLCTDNVPPITVLGSAASGRVGRFPSHFPGITCVERYFVSPPLRLPVPVLLPEECDVKASGDATAGTTGEPIAPPTLIPRGCWEILVTYRKLPSSTLLPRGT
ncbi:hypothetical protein HOY80DRAFT_1138404 [Tuber brumale]|nr:hypothetical protein HOY80DRAFT_1138404 [Tuber brumale]